MMLLTGNELVLLDSSLRVLNDVIDKLEKSYNEAIRYNVNDRFSFEYNITKYPAMSESFERLINSYTEMDIAKKYIERYLETNGFNLIDIRYSVACIAVTYKPKYSYNEEITLDLPKIVVNPKILTDEQTKKIYIQILDGFRAINDLDNKNAVVLIDIENEKLEVIRNLVELARNENPKYSKIFTRVNNISSQRVRVDMSQKKEY